MIFPLRYLALNELSVFGQLTHFVSIGGRATKSKQMSPHSQMGLKAKWAASAYVSAAVPSLTFLFML